MKKLLIIVILGLTLFSSGFFDASIAKDKASPHLEKIATSTYQWTGVAVTTNGRIFVNFPTWDDHPDFKVAELIDGKAIVYPGQEENQKFICVQSVVADKKDNLWILDPAKLRGQAVDTSGAKLFKVDLRTNKIVKTYVFPAMTALPQSYLNDVRFDGNGFAYLTDSGIGGIIVLNLESGESWRALTDIPEVKANLKSIDFVSTGPMNHVSQSDGLELSPNCRELYFTALGGTILYGIPTGILQNRNLTVAERRNRIEILNRNNVPTDGMVLRKDKLYMANLPREGIWEFNLLTRQGRNVPLGQAVRWADSFALAPDGSIYFTTSQINYPLPLRQTYGLYRLVW